MYRLSTAANTWTALSPSGSSPSPRHSMGFAATPDGMLYVIGGAGYEGNEREGGGSLYAAYVYVYFMHTYKGRTILHRYMRVCARVLAYVACMSAPSSICRSAACMPACVVGPKEI
jgi:hypothetical protein